MITTIPFDKLVPADGNVRRTGAEAGLDELAASIAAHGLLQNLTVRAALDDDGNPTGQHMVVAGGRRWHALRRLVKDGKLAGTAPIPCAVVGDHSDTEIGLAENLHLPMHPHDQYLAFARLADEGQASADIAARFGVSPRTVEQRLRLGRVAPALLALYRDGAMTLDALMAFTVTEDHARQEQAWAGLPTWNRSAELIRRQLTAAHVPASDRLARCVGMEAYEAAGGAVLRDLFDDARCWLTDPALLDRLATAEVESRAEHLRAEGWCWVRHGLDRPEVAIVGRVYPQQRDASPPERAEIDGIGTRKAEIEGRLEQSGGLDGAEGEALSHESAALDARLTAIADELLAYRDDDKARSGCLVWIDHQGGIAVQQGLVTEEELRAERPTAGDDELVAEEQPYPQGPASDRPAMDAADDGGQPKPLSAVLVEELTAHRTAGLKLALAGDPEIALAALIHALAGSVLGRIEQGGSCLDLSATEAHLGRSAPGIEDSPAFQAFEAERRRWGSIVPADSTGRWAWICAQDQPTRLDLLAFCVASTINAVIPAHGPDWRRPAPAEHADRLAEAAALDMTTWWQPTRPAYLDRVSKAHIIAAVAEAAGADKAVALDKLRKTALSEAAEPILAEAGWLPDPLRTRGIPLAAADDEEPAAALAAE